MAAGSADWWRVARNEHRLLALQEWRDLDRTVSKHLLGDDLPDDLDPVDGAA
ncbi:MAG TPA: hypothetical protein VLD35_08175 [Caldimonas sp.]|nr:hypothetical protein [Caldimonas sp.]